MIYKCAYCRELLCFTQEGDTPPTLHPQAAVHSLDALAWCYSLWYYYLEIAGPVLRTVLRPCYGKGASVCYNFDRLCLFLYFALCAIDDIYTYTHCYASWLCAEG